ncbi:UPF0319 protein yccT precursor [Erwinia amylovora Ea644]|uniref:YccT family protein n=1 Tax=Erwinia amylovora TaxID=552 RepID=UPI0002CC55E4|nr:DUF2057 family protein [Erwinia amylovora]CCP02798.1 UPF0319 protein yccT precursor [Erwinia amylovora Ea644]CCP06827.1 UPF0319 protein yccT precursor [Erwinia amylovora MR1]
MKLHMAITGLLALLVAANLQATTLKLSADIDLLVLDGRKISGSLLKGADGLELERGEHQLLFRVEKTVNNHPGDPVSWTSAPQVATFAAGTTSVHIKLPVLQTLREAKRFDNMPQFTLNDEHGAEVVTKRDHLRLKEHDSCEQAMRIYNLANKVASVPRFATPLPVGAQTGHLPDMASSFQPAQPVLRKWFLQVDSATRQHLIMLMDALHTS